MKFQVKLIKNEQRKAVAPIIATLLMVAISVVGGILIFVFAQGFFKDTSIQAPTLDAVEIWGYNAQDVAAAGFELHNNETVANCATGTINQKIDEAECLSIFLRNVGANAAIIQNVRLFGVVIPIDTTGAGPVAAGKPALFTYCLVHLLAEGCTGNQILEPGQEVSLIVHYDESEINGPIKIGRPIIFVIETGQGQFFTKQIRAGLQAGL